MIDYMSRQKIVWRIILGFVLAVLVTIVGLVTYVLYKRHEYQKIADTHDLKTRIEEMATRYLRRRTNAALVLGIAQRGHRHVLGFGRTSNVNRAAPDDKTIFEIGSVSKVFTALALARLVLDGAVRLDDPIDRFLPRDIRTPTRDGYPITLRHLATHTSGLPRLPANFDVVSTNEENPYVNYHKADLYRDLATVKLRARPGTRSDYSNYGFGLLGHILSLKSGKAYEALVKESVCRSLEMQDTAVRLSSEQRQRLTPGHDLRGAVVANWDFDVLASAGAFRSTAADLLKFIQANLDPAATPIAAVLTEAQREHFETWWGKVGLGWQIEETLEGPTFYWHNGGTGGYVSFVGFDRDHQTGIVLLSNYGDAMAGDDTTDEMALSILRLASKISWE